MIPNRIYIAGDFTELSGQQLFLLQPILFKARDKIANEGKSYSCCEVLVLENWQEGVRNEMQNMITKPKAKYQACLHSQDY